MERHLRRSGARSARQSEVREPLRHPGAAGRPQRLAGRDTACQTLAAWGATSWRGLAAQGIFDFYPRSPCGERPRPISRYTGGIHEHRRGRPAAEPKTRATRRTLPNNLTFCRCFSACSRFMIHCQVQPGYHSASNGGGAEWGLESAPYVSPGEVSGIGTAGAAQQRITARASGSGEAALRPCASSRVICMPVTQTRLTSARKPTRRLSASARPHLTD